MIQLPSIQTTPPITRATATPPKKSCIEKLSNCVRRIVHAFANAIRTLLCMKRTPFVPSITHQPASQPAAAPVAAAALPTLNPTAPQPTTPTSIPTPVAAPAVRSTPAPAAPAATPLSVPAPIAQSVPAAAPVVRLMSAETAPAAPPPSPSSGSPLGVQRALSGDSGVPRREPTPVPPLGAVNGVYSLAGVASNLLMPFVPSPLSNNEVGSGLFWHGGQLPKVTKETANDDSSSQRGSHETSEIEDDQTASSGDAETHLVPSRQKLELSDSESDGSDLSIPKLERAPRGPSTPLPKQNGAGPQDPEESLNSSEAAFQNLSLNDSEAAFLGLSLEELEQIRETEEAGGTFAENSLAGTVSNAIQLAKESIRKNETIDFNDPATMKAINFLDKNPTITELARENQNNPEIGRLIGLFYEKPARNRVKADPITPRALQDRIEAQTGKTLKDDSLNTRVHFALKAIEELWSAVCHDEINADGLEQALEASEKAMADSAEFVTDHELTDLPKEFLDSFLLQEANLEGSFKVKNPDPSAKGYISRRTPTLVDGNLDDNKGAGAGFANALQGNTYKSRIEALIATLQAAAKRQSQSESDSQIVAGLLYKGDKIYPVFSVLDETETDEHDITLNYYQNYLIDPYREGIVIYKFLDAKSFAAHFTATIAPLTNPIDGPDNTYKITPLVRKFDS